MNGAHKFVLLIVGLVVVCLTVLYSFLFIALWDYRQFVGLSLLAVIVLAALVFLRGRLTEQELRVVRYRHDVETPLDCKGEPVHWREGYQLNPLQRVNPAYPSRLEKGVQRACSTVRGYLRPDSHR